MKLDYQLKLEQNQKMIITPELKQAISLLQVSSMELMDHIQKELMNNPVLEIGENTGNDDGEPEEPAQDEPEPEDDFPWEEYLQYSGSEPQPFMTPAQEHNSLIENLSRSTGTMEEDLLGQLRMMVLTPEEYSIAAYLVGNLDSNGYLRADLEELAVSLGIEVSEIESVLTVLQSLEPAGIASRNLQECLMLQLRDRDDVPPMTAEIIAGFLPAAADCRFQYIASSLNCDLKTVEKAVAFIRTLNPKPGSIFGESEETRYIVPDIIVKKVDGQYVVISNESGLPPLMVNPYYHKLLQRRHDEKLTAFVKSKLERAYWLIRSIEQRRITVTRVAEQIVEFQHDFLEYGIKRLRPLTLKEVAQKINVHESTVSRAATNKYIQTPRGLFPFKFFFSSGVSGYAGSYYSSVSIKSYLSELIEQEDKNSPLSDQQLTMLLQEKGIAISRRTVAKYREEMSIPASHKRRRASQNY